MSREDLIDDAPSVAEALAQGLTPDAVDVRAESPPPADPADPLAIWPLPLRVVDHCPGDLAAANGRLAVFVPWPASAGGTWAVNRAAQEGFRDLVMRRVNAFDKLLEALKAARAEKVSEGKGQGVVGQALAEAIALAESP